MRWIQPKDGFSTGIEVYNCIVRKKVPLILRRKYLATLYTCGPTVYDDTHIGHASTYVKLDVIRRILYNHFGIRVFSVMNITDIDDKIIRKSQERKCSWDIIARENEDKFWKDLKVLDVLEPHVKMRVTENIQEILAFISELEDKGLAYRTKDNSVNFKVKDYGGYGKLKKVDLEEEKDVDFALWKGAKDGEPFWESPWGKGRPGWHVECSAMASKILGSSIDIHAGGIDLKFPHHENEEAQSCAFHGCDQWVNYWIHTGHLKLAGDAEKMSKSLKNTVSVNELLSKYSSNQFRMLCLLSNYRSSMVFSGEAMEMSQRILNKFLSFLEDTESVLRGNRQIGDFDQTKIFDKYSQSIQEIDLHLRDDFDTAKCLQVLQDFISFVNKEINSPPNEGKSSPEVGIIRICRKFILECLKNFGFSISGETAGSLHGSPADIVLDKIIEIRNSLRKEKNFSAADAIRDGLKDIGVEIKDHGQLSSWSRR